MHLIFDEMATKKQIDWDGKPSVGYIDHWSLRLCKRSCCEGDSGVHVDRRSFPRATAYLIG